MPDAPPRNWFAGNGYCYPFNLTQQPALSLPLGREAQGLPFGLQVVGGAMRTSWCCVWGSWWRGCWRRGEADWLEAGG